MTNSPGKISSSIADVRPADASVPTVQAAPRAALQTPGASAIAPLKPGVERLGSTGSSTSAGAMGVHPSQLATFDAADTTERLLAPLVTLAEPNVMQARLSGLVAELGLRSGVDHIVNRLKYYSGETIRLSEVVDLFRKADESSVASLCRNQPLHRQVATVAGVLVDDTAALHAAAKIGALETQPGDVVALRELLARNVSEGLKAIEAQAPHNPELVADILAVAGHGVSRWRVARAVETFGAAAVPALVHDIENAQDLRAACGSLNKLGRVAVAAVDPLWRALEARRGIAGDEAGKSRGAILEALAGIGGDRLVGIPNAVEVIREAYVTDRAHDREGAAVRIIAAMDGLSSRFLDVITDKNALADVLNCMGPTAWEHLPTVLAKRDDDFWWRIMNVVGPPPTAAALELVRIARAGEHSCAMVEPLRDAARAGMSAEAREVVVPFLREELVATDERSAAIAYDALLSLLPHGEHRALVLDGLRGSDHRRSAILEIQRAEGITPDPEVAEALRAVLAGPATDLWCRMRIRQVLKHPAREIAQDGLDHLLTAQAFEPSDVYDVARAFGDAMGLSTLARLLDAANPEVRLKAAEIIVQRVEHRPIETNAVGPLTKLFEVVDKDPELAAIREYPYDEIRAALAKVAT